MIFDNFNTHSQARAFMTAIREQGFECGETVGGVTVFDHSITPENYNELSVIAQKYDANKCLQGETFMQTMMEAMRQEKRLN